MQDKSGQLNFKAQRCLGLLGQPEPPQASDVSKHARSSRGRGQCKKAHMPEADTAMVKIVKGHEAVQRQSRSKRKRGRRRRANGKPSGGLKGLVANRVSYNPRHTALILDKQSSSPQVWTSLSFESKTRASKIMLMADPKPNRHWLIFAENDYRIIHCLCLCLCLCLSVRLPNRRRDILFRKSSLGRRSSFTLIRSSCALPSSVLFAGVLFASDLHDCTTQSSC